MFRLALFLTLLAGLSTAADTPSKYHVLSDVRLTPVRDAGDCNAAIFALNTALEIAHFKATGNLVQFSEQEYVDCVWSGCRTRGVLYYIIWLQVMDRIASVDQYVGFSGEKYTCRAGTSPNSLSAFKVTGQVEVTPDTVETAILKYGSVLACIDTEKCPQYEDYDHGVIETDEGGEMTCRQTVIIVGYTADSYIVRNSRGSQWGDEGYFRITRNRNTCGIEENMLAVTTEARDAHWNEANAFSVNGCPPELPIYCNATRTCTEPGHECVKATDDDFLRHHNTRSKRATERRVCEDEPGLPCSERLVQYCKYERVRDLCGATCKVPCPDDIDDNIGCQDKVPERCATTRIKSYCSHSTGVRAMCPETCQVPKSECSKKPTYAIERRVRDGFPPYGPCYLPVIPNGRVMNKALIKSGERLVIQCDEGYELVGGPAFCELQDVFKPDSRRLPECIKVGGEEFTGNGEDYKGKRSETVEGKTCGNWKELLYTGRFLTPKQGEALKGRGNHNFCRAGPDDWVPSCMTTSMANMAFCFSKPGCEGSGVCSGNLTDIRDDCSENARCEGEHEGYIEQVKYFYNTCAATCCERAGC